MISTDKLRVPYSVPPSPGSAIRMNRQPGQRPAVPPLPRTRRDGPPTNDHAQQVQIPDCSTQLAVLKTENQDLENRVAELQRIADDSMSRSHELRAEVSRLRALLNDRDADMKPQPVTNLITHAAHAIHNQDHQQLVLHLNNEITHLRDLNQQLNNDIKDRRIKELEDELKESNMSLKKKLLLIDKLKDELKRIAATESTGPLVRQSMLNSRKSSTLARKPNPPSPNSKPTFSEHTASLKHALSQKTQLVTQLQNQVHELETNLAAASTATRDHQTANDIKALTERIADQSAKLKLVLADNASYKIQHKEDLLKIQRFTKIARESDLRLAEAENGNQCVSQDQKIVQLTLKLKNANRVIEQYQSDLSLLGKNYDQAADLKEHGTHKSSTEFQKYVPTETDEPSAISELKEQLRKCSEASLTDPLTTQAQAVLDDAGQKTSAHLVFEALMESGPDAPTSNTQFLGHVATLKALGAHPFVTGGMRLDSATDLPTTDRVLRDGPVDTDQKNAPQLIRRNVPNVNQSVLARTSPKTSFLRDSSTSSQDPYGSLMKRPDSQSIMRLRLDLDQKNGTISQLEHKLEAMACAISVTDTLRRQVQDQADRIAALTLERALGDASNARDIEQTQHQLGAHSVLELTVKLTAAQEQLDVLLHENSILRNQLDTALESVRVLEAENARMSARSMDDSTSERLDAAKEMNTVLEQRLEALQAELDGVLKKNMELVLQMAQ